MKIITQLLLLSCALVACSAVNDEWHWVLRIPVEVLDKQCKEATGKENAYALLKERSPKEICETLKCAYPSSEGTACEDEPEDGNVCQRHVNLNRPPKDAVICTLCSASNANCDRSYCQIGPCAD